MQKAPTLEKFHFLPYVPEVTTEYDPYMTTYLKTCSSICRSLLNKISSNNSFPNMTLLQSLASSEMTEVSEEYIEKISSQPNSGLLYLLDKMNKLTVMKTNTIENIHSSLSVDLSSDHLLSYSKRPEILKIYLDIVLENTSKTKVKVLEVDASHARFYKKVIPYLLSQPMVLVDYTSTNQEDALATAAGVHFIKWDMMNNISPPIVDVAIASNVLHKQTDFNSSLKNLVNILDDEGFLIVEEAARHLEVPTCLEALITDQSEIIKHRKDFFLTQQELKLAFADAGLEVLCTRSGPISDMYLLRKVKPLKFIKVMIDNLHPEWFEELKTSFESIATNNDVDRLWLVSLSCPVNGILGLVNCLRKEDGGHKIR